MTMRPTRSACCAQRVPDWREVWAIKSYLQNCSSALNYWFLRVDCEASANAFGRVFLPRITKPNRTRTCLCATLYQTLGITFKPIFSPGSQRSSGRSRMHKQVITVLELARVDDFVQTRFGGPGRPEKDRKALARAFAAKAVLGLPLTNMLIERLQVDKQLRRLCGWQHPKQIPSESTF